MADAQIIPLNPFLGINSKYLYQRGSWYGAGTDSTTKPPTQDPDLFESLVNCAPPVQGVLQFRPGTRKFYPALDKGTSASSDETVSTVGPAIKATNFGLYQNRTDGERTLVGMAADGTGTLSLTNKIVYWDASGNPTVIFTPSAGAASPRMVNSRDYAYFTDTVATDQTKWNIDTGKTNWGITAPISAPTLVPTNSTPQTWVASTVFSTFGTIVDSNNNVQCLIGVNADGSNPTSQFGKSGAGTPAFSSSGSTISDNNVLWQDRGPVGLWQASTTYNNFSTNLGTLANPSVIYDPTTKFLYGNTNPGAATGKSGQTKPDFGGIPGGVTFDGEGALGGGVEWYCIGAVGVWKPNNNYTSSAVVNTNSVIVDPCGLSAAYDTTSSTFTTPLHVQFVTRAGTSGTGNTTNTWATIAGAKTADGQLSWMCKGSAAWPASTLVVAFAGVSNSFTLIKDTNGNLQVCSVGGNTASSHPAWATTYGATTTEVGGVTWVCLGPSMSWAALTSWYFPVIGFGLPSSTTTFVGATITDSNSNLETVIVSGLTSTTAPVWPAQGNPITDGGVTWFNLGPAVAGVLDVTLLTGRRYFLAYQNSTSGGFSDLSPVSGLSGPVTNGEIFVANLSISVDPQVDTKVLLATADGGDPTTLYLVTSLANSVTSYTDSTIEADLLLANIYQETDSSGNFIGLAFNTLPPNGSFPIEYNGRLWMASGNQLFFSKSLGDLTTSSGIIAGRYEECWPLTNTITISEGAEFIRGLFTDGNALYIETDLHVRRITGSGPLDFSLPSIAFSNTGVVNNSVTSMVFTEEVPIGAMWLTPDFRVLLSDFNTYDNVGASIQSTLNSINTAAMGAIWANAWNDGLFAFYVLAIPTGTNTVPDTLCVFDTRQRKWYTWTGPDTFSAGIYYVNIGGIPRFVVCDSTGVTRIFDKTKVVDHANETPEVPIVAPLKTVWLNFGDPTTHKTLNELEVDTTYTNMTVTVEGASEATQFASPHTVINSGKLVQNVFGQYKLFLTASPTIDRYYRFTFTAATSSTNSPTDTLLGYYSLTVEPLHRN